MQVNPLLVQFMHAFTLKCWFKCNANIQLPSSFGVSNTMGIVVFLYPTFAYAYVIG